MWQFVDWHVEDDRENIRSGAIELRAKNIAAVYMPKFETNKASLAYIRSPRVQWRVAVLDKFELFAHRPISGKIIEIGAGTGLGSAMLSTKPNVEAVYALDYEPYSVEELMPRVFESAGGNPDKLIRVLGSFNKMKCDDQTFDFIIAFGALHHSENLEVTLTECYRVLKPGGYLIASEPCEINSMTKADECRKANKVIPIEQTKTKFGEQMENVRYQDESNQVLRLCQYETASYNTGFDAYPFIFDDSSFSGGRWANLWRRGQAWIKGDKLFSEPTYAGFAKTIMYPYFAPVAKGSKKRIYDRLLLVLHKPLPENVK